MPLVIFLFIGSVFGLFDRNAPTEMRWVFFWLTLTMGGCLIAIMG
jgi:hypothetical protein